MTTVYLIEDVMAFVDLCPIAKRASTLWTPRS